MTTAAAERMMTRPMPPVISETDRRTAYAAARKLCRDDRTASHGAHLAAYFVPRAKCDHVYAVWAFARLIQQAVTPADPDAATSGTSGTSGGGGGCCSGGGGVGELLKSRIDDAYADRAGLPLPQFRDDTQWAMLALIDTVRRVEIPKHLWFDFIDGLGSSTAVRRYATWNALDAHLAKTGASVACVVASVLGMQHSDGSRFAAAVGRAARLTAILRDLPRDVAQGRILLPLEDLARFRYSERDLLARTVNDRFRELLRFQINGARELFRAGAEGTCWLADDGSRLAAAAFVSLQLAQLDELERNIDATFTHSAAKRPSLASQLRHLPAAWRLARRQAGQPMPRLT